MQLETAEFHEIIPLQFDIIDIDIFNINTEADPNRDCSSIFVLHFKGI